MNRKCPKCYSTKNSHRKFGYFIRKSDKKRILRYQCCNCGKHFSQATTQSCYWQKKRKLNPRIRELLVSGVSQRRIAKLLKTTRVTVSRKFMFLGRQAKKQNSQMFDKLDPLLRIQFDDLETFEHTKCKPLSVIMAVVPIERRIIAFEVCSMPAKGSLAKISLKKYGKRKDDRKVGRQRLFKKLQTHPLELIESDESPHYTADVKAFFPQAEHKTYKGKRGCITGQGELKKVGFDPLFSLNHSFAMLRANINRLFRKTWCTTKVPERLSDHIELYVAYHNSHLI